MSRSTPRPTDAVATDPPGVDTADGDDALDDIRILLDGLARSSAPDGLASTTIEMAAVSTGGRTAPRSQPALRTRSRSWWVTAGCVLGALALGPVVGRATTTDPDQRILEYLPVVEHLGVLQEAGSVEFLRAVAERDYPAPRRFPFGRAPDERGTGGGGRPDDPQEPSAEADDWQQLTDTLDALQEGPFGPETPGGEVDARRERVEELDEESRRRLADAAKTFQEMPLARRHDLIELARAFGEGEPDGELDALLGAARSWHRWLAWRDPADRHAVVALETHERLEWLDRYARFNARPMFPTPSGRGGSGGRGFGGDRPGPGRGNRDGAAERRGGGPSREPETDGQPDDRPVTPAPGAAAETP